MLGVSTQPELVQVFRYVLIQGETDIIGAKKRGTNKSMLISAVDGVPDSRAAARPRGRGRRR